MSDANFKNLSFIIVIFVVLLITFGFVSFFAPIDSTPVYTDTKSINKK